MATRTIGTELVLSGEKEFNDAMKSINSNLKNMRADMARVTAEFEGNADSMEALTSRQKILQDSVEQHRAKVDALQRMYDEQKKKFGENSAMADKFKLQLTQATTALIKEEKALEKTTAALSAQEAASQEATDAAEKLADEEKAAATAAENASKKQQRYAEKLEYSEKRSEALKSGLEKLGGATAAVAKATAAGVAAIAAAGGVALAGMISMAKEAAEAAKTAQEAGEELTASQQQWLAFAGQLDTLNASVADAKSALVSILLPTLSELSTEGSTFLGDFVSSMNAAAGDTEKQTEILGQYIAKGAKLIIQKLPEYINSGKDLLKSVGEGLSEEGPELLTLGGELLEDLLRSIINNAPKLAEGGLEMVLQLIEGIDGEDMAVTAAQLVTRLVSGLAAATPKLIPAAVTLVGELVIGLAKSAPELLSSGWDLLINILDGIFSAVGEIPKVWREVLDVLLTAMRSSDSKILQFGADVVEWIAGGIIDAWDGLVSWFNGLWDSLFSDRDVDINVNQSSGGGNIDGSHAGGLRYVPFDGYLAQLHRGEAVLPADEAAAYRSGQAGSSRIFNLTINAKSVSKEELDMIVDYMNRKLGENL